MPATVKEALLGKRVPSRFLVFCHYQNISLTVCRDVRQPGMVIESRSSAAWLHCLHAILTLGPTVHASSFSEPPFFSSVKSITSNSFLGEKLPWLSETVHVQYLTLGLEHSKHLINISNDYNDYHQAIAFPYIWLRKYPPSGAYRFPRRGPYGRVVQSLPGLSQSPFDAWVQIHQQPGMSCTVLMGVGMDSWASFYRDHVN